MAIKHPFDPTHEATDEELLDMFTVILSLTPSKRKHIRYMAQQPEYVAWADKLNALASIGE